MPKKAAKPKETFKEGEAPTINEPTMITESDPNDHIDDFRFKQKNVDASRELQGAKQGAPKVYIAHEGEPEKEMFTEPCIYECSCVVGFRQAHNRYCVNCGRAPDAYRKEQKCYFTEVAEGKEAA